MAKLGMLLRKPGGPDFSELLDRFRRLMQVVAVSPRPRIPPGGTMYPPLGHQPTQVQDGRILCPEGLAPVGLSQGIMRFWDQELWTDAARVARWESSWKFDAVLDTRDRVDGTCGKRYWFSDEVGWATTEFSVGYFQINVCAHGGDFDYWIMPDHNAAKAAQLYNQSGWRPWVVTATRLGLIAG